MKLLTKKTTTRLKIVGATFTTIFTLLTAFVGTIAWFVANQHVEATGMTISIAVSNCTIDSFNLFKFDYSLNTFGDIDYLSPQDGKVDKYPYVSQSGFGVSEMNVYDPIEKVVMGNSFDLRKMNCNAIYEAVISSQSFVDAYLDSTAVLRDDVVLGANQTLLSSCVDFDLFYEHEIADTVNGAINLDLYTSNGLPKYLPTSYASPLNIAYVGATTPNDNLGSFGDLYLDTTTNYLYVKTASGWGEHITSRISSSTDVPEGSTDSLSYHVKTDSHNVYRYIDNWALCKSAYLGVSGTYDSSTPGIPEDDDYFLDSSSGVLKQYDADEDSWTTINSINGYYFLDEDSGDVYYNNSGWNAFVTAEDDLFLDYNTSTLYTKGETAWAQKANIEAEKVYYKISYLASINYKSTWASFTADQTGDSVPTNAVEGESGDRYIRTDTHDLYIKTDNSWGNPLTIKKGLTGINGASGETAPQTPATNDYFFDEENNVLKQYDGSDWGNVTPTNGDYYYGETTSILYLYNDGAWAEANVNTDDYFYANISSTVYKFNGTTWSASSCSEGDYFIDVVSHGLKYYHNSSWEAVAGNLSGAVAPQEATGNPGDKYVETTNNDLYIKASTSWGNPLQIKKGTVGTSLPVSPSENDYFLDSSTNTIKQYDGSSWQNVVMNEGDYYIDVTSNDLYRFQKHAHFYEGGNPTLATSGEVTFSGGQVKLYINVNYAPNQLDGYTDKVYINKTRAVRDFAFSFNFKAGV